MTGAQTNHPPGGGRCNSPCQAWSPTARQRHPPLVAGSHPPPQTTASRSVLPTASAKGTPFFDTGVSGSFELHGTLLCAGPLSDPRLRRPRHRTSYAPSNRTEEDLRWRIETRSISWYRRAARAVSNAWHQVVGGFTSAAARVAATSVVATRRRPSMRATMRQVLGIPSSRVTSPARTGSGITPPSSTRSALSWCRRAITRSSNPCRDQSDACHKAGSDSCTDREIEVRVLLASQPHCSDDDVSGTSRSPVVDAGRRD